LQHETKEFATGDLAIAEVKKMLGQQNLENSL